MKKKIKNIIMFNSILFSTISGVNAQNKNIEVRANILSGCVISAEDIDFGMIDGLHFLKTKDAVIYRQKNMGLQCSKGTNVTITQDGGKNRDYVQFWENAMIRLGSDGRWNNLIAYIVSVSGSSDDPLNYKVVSPSTNNHIIGETHKLTVKLLTDKKANIRYSGEIHKQYNSLNTTTPGVYQDTINFKITF